MTSSKFAAALGLLLCSGLALAQNLVVKGKTVHTMAGPSITDGVIIIKDGKIASVGKAADAKLPDGVKVIEAAVVTPGLVDARGTVGVSGLYNTKHDSDQLERSAAIQPEMRAIDAYNPMDKLVEWVRGFGITTVNTGNAPGALVSGQTIVVKTVGNTVDEAVILSPAMVTATIGPGSLESGGKAPGTRGKQVSMLREELIKAKEYTEKRKAAEARKKAGAEKKDDTKDDSKEEGKSGGGGGGDSRNLRLEMLSEVLDGKVPLTITVNRAQDIESAIRVQKEFGFKLILDMAAESYLVADQLKAANIPVILHPTMYRAVGEAENLSFETAAKLKKAGVLFAIQSGYESYVPKTRVVLFEAALAAANGLKFEDALASITIDAAKIIGVDKRVGSLEPGKDADLALFDADPFEYTSHCIGTVIDGKVASEGKK